MIRKIMPILAVLFICKAAFAYEDVYYSTLYQKASQAIEKNNEQEADFYLARYAGASLLDENSKKTMSDLYPLLKSYKVSAPTAFISGRYSKDFIDWFIDGSHSQWGRTEDEDINIKNRSFTVAAGSNKDYFAAIVGSPYLEGWSIIKGDDIKTAILTLIDYRQKPYIAVAKRNNSASKSRAEKTYLELDEHHIQYVWPIEFHDLDGDGKDELWVRYNKAWADGFSQELSIYRIKDGKLELIKKFEGEAEGIARRLEGNKIEVGNGFSDKSVGHMGYDQHHLETWEYKNGKFTKISERDVPHVLWSKEWEKYYLDK